MCLYRAKSHISLASCSSVLYSIPSCIESWCAESVGLPSNCRLPLLRTQCYHNTVFYVYVIFIPYFKIVSALSLRPRRDVFLCECPTVCTGIQMEGACVLQGRLCAAGPSVCCRAASVLPSTSSATCVQRSTRQCPAISCPDVAMLRLYHCTILQNNVAFKINTGYKAPFLFYYIF